MFLVLKAADVKEMMIIIRVLVEISDIQLMKKIKIKKNIIWNKKYYYNKTYLNNVYYY